MAVIDDTRGVLVVRIVYDGPALSGKTTSLQALARGVGREMTTPEQTAGRTLFFDWVDYVGGLFDGRQIRCQIVSVPGQLELAERRQVLLESADAVVLVLDTRQHEWEFSRSWVARTVPACRSKDPPVGLVLQANKRDAEDAVPSEEMRLQLAKIAPIAVVPSTATTGEGIREAFVMAVRLALDRVRALAASGRLGVGKPAEDSPEELLERLRGAETGPARILDTEHGRELVRALDEHEFAAALQGAPRAQRTSSVPASSPDSEPEAVFVPDPHMPGGMIWPPVDGRALLHEVASLDIRPTRVGRADWAGSGSGFRFHSTSSALFNDAGQARSELLEWARLHTTNRQHLSPGRAVILADAGSGRLRLWQVVRSEATLRERLAAALPSPDPMLLAKELLEVTQLLSQAREFFSSCSVNLPCTLWTVAATLLVRPAFVGLMPSREHELPLEAYGYDLVERELAPQLRELRRSRVDYSQVVEGVTELAWGRRAGEPAQWLRELTERT
jgi:signal recognition particle receptor subunit beta